MQKRNASRNSRLSHPEKRERTGTQSENHTFRGAVFHESSKTDSGADQRCVLPMSLDRSRNKFGMTPKDVPSLRGVSVANDVAIPLGTRHWLAGLLRHYVPRNDTGAQTGFGLQTAFTMAEILLSLTIIGVVAAITLPSLTGNINERTWNTQRKALYARFSQAIALMPALNGYGTLTEGDSSTSAVDTAAETFVTSGLAKVMKINNICDNEHLEDCGITSKINTINNSTITPFPQTLVEFNPLFSNSLSGGWDYQQIDTKAVAFETANGESIVTYYNPYCISDLDELNSERTWYHSQSKMCANFIYDLNGKKGPNTVGKDIGFITVLYPSDPIVVAPMPTNNDAPNKLIHIQAVAYCKQEDSESRLPNIDEASAMFYNKPLLGFKNENYWTSTVYSSTKAWYQSFSAGDRYHIDKSTPEYVRCVKR